MYLPQYLSIYLRTAVDLYLPQYLSIYLQTAVDMYLPQYLSIYLQTAADQTPLRVWLLEQLARDLAEVVDEAHRGSLLQGILDAAAGHTCYYFFLQKETIHAN